LIIDEGEDEEMDEEEEEEVPKKAKGVGKLFLI
jgi:hypothetical protein